MILAAGRGKRLRPLTDDLPKPLIRAGGHALIDYQLRALSAADVRDVVVNTSWLPDRLHEAVGAGDEYGLSVRWSDEGDIALETAGGIANALPLLGPQPFMVINGDVFADYSLDRLRAPAGKDLAHLVLVPNPAHNPSGDFVLDDGRVVDGEGERLTFAGIATYRPELFAGVEGVRALAPLLIRAIADGRISGERFDGRWWDVGTRERLDELDRWLSGTG